MEDGTKTTCNAKSCDATVRWCAACASWCAWENDATWGNEHNSTKCSVTRRDKRRKPLDMDGGGRPKRHTGGTALHGEKEVLDSCLAGKTLPASSSDSYDCDVLYCPPGYFHKVSSSDRAISYQTYLCPEPPVAGAVVYFATAPPDWNILPKIGTFNEERLPEGGSTGLQDFIQKYEIYG